MNSIATPEPSRSSRAMLCSLSISMWSARKHDLFLSQTLSGSRKADSQTTPGVVKLPESSGTAGGFPADEILGIAGRHAAL